jgi:hypothetical protein
VYDDQDGNKERGPGEPLLTGAVLTVKNSQGMTVGTWITNGTEPHCFYLPPDTYTVTEADPTGYTSTTPNIVTVMVTAGFAAYEQFGDQSSAATPTPTATTTPTSPLRWRIYLPLIVRGGFTP